MRSITRSLFTFGTVVVLAAACASSGVAAPQSPEPTAGAPAPAPTPERTMEMITAPPATPKPTTDGEGAEHVTGVITNAVLSTPVTRVKVDRADGVTEELRDGVATITFDVNDPRVDGKATWPFSVDLYTTMGPEWATMRIVKEQGAWEGPCGGGVWAGGDGLLQSCWLIGSGDFEGYTYHLTFTGPANGDKDRNGIVQGIIYPGAPPSP